MNERTTIRPLSAVVRGGCAGDAALQVGGLHAAAVVVTRGPRRHGERSGRVLLADQFGAADQQSGFAAATAAAAVAAVSLAPAARTARPADCLTQYGGGTARLCALRAAAVLARERAVLLVQARVHVLARGARARLQEALFEVVAEERVQDRVHRAVAIAQAAGQQEYRDHDLRLTLFGRREY